jgi:hypothetical protein
MTVGSIPNLRMYARVRPVDLHLSILTSRDARSSKEADVDRGLAGTSIQPIPDAFQPLLGRPTATGFSLSGHTSNLRGKPHEAGLRQAVVSRLQHHTASDIDSSVEAPGHELHAFVASGRTHKCKNC